MAIPALIGAAVPLIGKAIDAIFPDPAEREAAKLKLLQAENEGRLKETEVALSAILAEANSSDPWTSRARPTFLYVMYGVIGLCFLGGILGVWWPDQAAQAAVNIGQMFIAIPDDLWWLFGAGYLGYSASRSFDKRSVAKVKEVAGTPWRSGG